MTRRLFFALALLLALTTLIARSAHAEPRALADTLKDDAKRQYDAGRALYRAGDYRAALVNFQRAYALTPDPRLLWNMAACEKGEHHYATVLGLVDQYLAKGGALLNDADRKEALAFRDAVHGLVSDVTFVVDQAEATVYVDDAPIGATPLAAAVPLDPGPRRIRVVKAHFKDAVRTETLAGAVPARIEIAMDRIREGRLVVNAKSDDVITVDDEAVGTARWSGVVASGAHVVRVTAAGKKGKRIDVSVKDDETRTLDVVLEPERASLLPWFVGGGVALAAGAAVAALFLLRSSSSPPAQTAGNAGIFQLP